MKHLLFELLFVVVLHKNIIKLFPCRDPLDDDTADVLPWESSSRDFGGTSRRRQDSAADSGSSSSDVSAAVSAGERMRRLPQQSTLDGGLRGAPPPLRRLSAVEPRHLTPLASPPHSPRPPRPVQHQPPPVPPPLAHPTPTISVSSAPDDESGTGSPEEPRSIAQSDEPSSVFASADATPTEPVRHAFKCEASPVDGACETSQETLKECTPVRPLTSIVGGRSIDSCEDSGVSDSRDSTDRTRSSSDDVVSVRRVLSREPSTIKETSPASIKDTCNKADIPEIDDDTVMECVPVVELTITEPDQVEAVECVAPPTPESSGPGAAGAAPAPEPAGAAPDAPGPAPLAVCEDIGVDDDNVDKVPSAPLHRVSEDSRASDADATKTIAHKDELTSVSQTTIVKRDNKGIGEHKQRNDICPWEDE